MMNNNFVIYGQGRSGSNLLRTLLSSHPQIHCANEIFNPIITTKKNWVVRFIIKNFPLRYVHKKANEANVDIYGFKLFLFHHKDSKTIVEKLYRKGWKIIHIQRQNALKQTFSSLIGIETNQYFRKKGMPDPSGIHTISCKQIEITLNRRKSNLLIEKNYIAGFDPFPVIYEQDLKDKNKWQETTNRVYQFLGVEPVESSSDNIISDPRTDSERIENFDEIINYLNQNGCAEDVELYYKNL